MKFLVITDENEWIDTFDESIHEDARLKAHAKAKLNAPAYVFEVANETFYRD